MILKEKVLAFGPDIVMFAFNINDLEELKLEGKQKSKIQRRDFILKDNLHWIFRKTKEFGNEYSYLLRLIDNLLRGLAIQFHYDKPGKRFYYKQFYEKRA